MFMYCEALKTENCIQATRMIYGNALISTKQKKEDGQKIVVHLN